ncbi:MULTISPECIES: M23 family metallopeptidase [unclassified Microbacterium]|mgnify:CR=1 FL=1|uniref:M23 family metallopeptidase n=1 Tax=unclassified Microbacterium TaxID=2609290 RepID=UPI0025F03D10|nr:M23 family metallopeptidase [Microbacterium sp.]
MAGELEQTSTSETARVRTRERSVGRSVVRPLRTVAILAAVGALVTAIALPALVTGAPASAGASPATAQQLAAHNAQSIVVASEATQAPSTREQFTATTPDEIAKKKADEEAARALEAAKAAALASLSSPTTASVRTSMPSIALPGQVIYPMAAGSYTLSDGFGAARTGRSHMGQDFAAPIGTPIYAISDGCVQISQSDYGGYGDTVQISHPALSGSGALSTLYGHMSYRAVSVGQCVTAGQYLGEVGNTGWVSGSCLHFEVLINNTEIDPLAWLQANVL